MQTRHKVHRFIGEPWDIKGDGLIVFTNNKYKIHNGKFQADIKFKARQGYQQDTKLLAAVAGHSINSGVASREVVVINGYNLTYGAVILVPIEAYKKGEDL